MRRTRPEEEMRACSCSHGPLSASSLEPTRHRTPWLGVPHRPSCCRSGAAATAAAALAFVCEAATTKVRWPAPWSFIHAGLAALPVIRQWCRAGMICVALSLSHGQISRAGSSSGGGTITMAAAQRRLEMTAQRLGTQQLGDAARPAASVRRRRCRAAAGSWTEDRVAARWRLNL